MNITPVVFPAHDACTERDLSVVTYEVIHHSVTPLTTTVLEIDQMHRARGFAMFGYNFAVDTHGTVFQGRQMDWVPAACEGFNTPIVAVVLIGQFEPAAADYNGPPSKEQLAALVDLSVYIHEQIPSISSTVGHSDIGHITPPPIGPYIDQCPGATVENYLPTLRALVAARMGK